MSVLLRRQLHGLQSHVPLDPTHSSNNGRLVCPAETIYGRGSERSASMRLNDIREWRNQPWTRLYEAALFEPDTVKLCTRLWEAQLAILSREREIRQGASAEDKEQLALRKAMGILLNLRRLVGFDHESRPSRILPVFSLTRLRTSAASSRRGARRIPA